MTLKSTEPAPIAVIGMACRFPHAPDLPAMWHLIATGEVAFEDIGDARWTHSQFLDTQDVRAPDKTYATRAAFIKGIDEFAALHYGIPPRRVQVMDPQQRLAIEISRQALQDAGYDTRPYDRANTGVFVGASVSEYKELATARHRIRQLIAGEFGPTPLGEAADSALCSMAGLAPMRTFSVSGALLNMLACGVSQTFDLGGPAIQIDAACSSALVAIHEAVMHLRAREIHLALAGGVYVNLSPDNQIGFSRIGAISRSNACRPFDAAADGFVMGEGIGMVVLKRLDDAVRDRDNIYAVIRGSGSNNDGKGVGPMTPRVQGQKEVMSRAHRHVDFPVESIGFLEGHGTATTVGDKVEVDALKEFFREKAGKELATPHCYLGSIKANIGHTMSAAGVAGFIKACLAISHGIIPPQPSASNPNPDLDLAHSPFKLAEEACAWPTLEGGPRRAAVSSFGFGGTNAHILLEEAPPLAEAKLGESGPELFVVSAPSQALLREYAGALAAEIAAEQLQPSEVAATLARRSAGAVRAAFVASTHADTLAKLGAIARGETQGRTLSAEKPKVAFLFPGQGAQRTGLFAGAMARWTELRRSFERLAAAASAATGVQIEKALYPDVADAEAQANLTRTEVCQPALAALDLSLAEFLSAVGVKPSFCLGHSLGDFVAASVGGMVSDEDAVKLVAARGAAMSALQLEDSGTMSAVRASAEQVREILGEIRDVVVANHNHALQTVISGSHGGVAEAEERLRSRGFTCTRLEVSHAFHSPLMAPVDDSMPALIARARLHAPATPVISCITAAPYETPDSLREVWAHHGTSQVRFFDALAACQLAGANVYVQVGPGSALLAFARAMRASDPTEFLSLGGGEGDEHGAQLLETVGTLWMLGATDDVHALTGAARATLPPSPLETQKYWIIERGPVAPTPYAQPARTPVRPIPPRSQTMDNLIALFQQQAQVFLKQAEALRAHGLPSSEAALLGDFASVKTAAAFASPEAPAAAAPELSIGGLLESVANLVSSPSNALKSDIPEKVFASVARISAFSAENLRSEQTLVGELGFDSLMLVELDGDIGKAWPAVGGLPRDLFRKTTTIGEVIDYVAQRLGTPEVSEPQKLAPASAPLERYRPYVFPSPLRQFAELVSAVEQPVLVTEDSRGIAEAVVAQLASRGIAATLGAIDTPGNFGHIVHLADVDSQASFHAPTERLLGLVRRLPRERTESLLIVTGLGGQFGLTGLLREQLGLVGLHGFAKSLAKEWDDVAVKCVDVDLSLDKDAIAQALVDELLSADRAAEIGLTADGRVAVSLLKEPISADAISKLDADSTILVTGGVRGLGASFALGLAKHLRGGRFSLWGSSAPSDTSAAVCNALLAAGAKAATYRAVDLRDRAAVYLACEGQRVDAVLHAAGVLSDSAVERKDLAQVEAVLQTKVGGALNLLDGLSANPPQVFALVGSWAGRFGNAGQVDYAAANEMLARIPEIGAWRPTRIITVSLPPVDGTAMAKRIPAFRLAEWAAQGIALVSQKQATDAIVQEVMIGSGEIVVGAGLPERTLSYAAAFPVSRLNHIYLNDHAMAGQPVLPFAAALDHAVGAALDAAGEPLGTASFTVERFALRHAVFVPDTTWLEVKATQEVRDGAGSAWELRIVNGASVAYEGRIALGAQGDAPSVPRLFPEAPALSLEDFYAHFTFHGPKLRGISEVTGLGENGVSGWVRTSKPEDWIREPMRSEWAVDPLVIDAAFQLVGYWAWVKHKRAGFPVGFGKYVQLHPFGEGLVRVCAEVKHSEGDIFTGALRWEDANGALLAYMTETRAELTQRDPQFGASAASPEAPDDPRCNPALFPEYLELEARKQMIATMGVQNPYFALNEGVARDTTVVDGKRMLNFSSYNYLGTSGDPAVSNAAKDAIDTFGTSASASRVASGDKPVTRELEIALAKFFHTEDCTVFVSGHATNVTVLGCLAGPQDLIVHDALAHDSIIQGAKLSGAKRRSFPHNDYRALDRLLGEIRGQFRRTYIAIEGVYSMDGDISPLPQFIEIKKKHHAMLLVDEAHSAGVLGESGRGIAEHFGIASTEVELWMGTLSKTFASCGGYIAGSHALCEYLRYSAPGFVYSVGIPPASAAAALASTRLILSEPKRVQKLRDNAARFVALLKARGINTGMSKGSGVVPAILASSELCLQLSDALKRRGVNVQPILYPAVEEDQARLRFFLSSTHSIEQLEMAANIIKEELNRLTRSDAGEAVG